MHLVDALVHALRRPSGRHCLDKPQPGQLPAHRFNPEDAYDVDDDLYGDDPFIDNLRADDVLAPYLVALERAEHAPRFTVPELNRRDDTWPYNLDPLSVL